MNGLRASLFAMSLGVVFSAPAHAQDPLKVDPQHYKVVIDNPSVRVIRVNYAPGSKSVAHSHPESIFVSLSASKTRFTMPDGKTQDMDMAADSAMYLPAGVHTPENTGTTPVDGVLIEFKAPAPGKATIPTSRPEMTMKVLAEGPRAVAHQMASSPKFAEPPGTTHEFDQVVVALVPMQLSLAIEGKPARTSWARGDVVFIGRGVPHEAKNTGGKPGSTVNVLIR